MSNTQCALLGLASWQVLMLFLLAGFRLYIAATRKKAANTFAPDGSDVPGFGQRLVRVHANCYENIPLFLALLLFAMASNQTAITDPGALILLGARIGQSVVHMISTSVPAVLLRFALFLVQVLTAVCWLYQFLDA
ncbi:MAG: MAPEG family protein [Pseudomonadales bacterium]|jgi:uncharacterized MAPEG superfamily protein|nr:MAPEG family protein [Pseudomonadales bacterium]